ncbi:MAG: hypothetical protein FJZ86_05050 [Chloroflexi bacterium]|nr:hypothetical protein [Chloroflexota bacterium]
MKRYLLFTVFVSGMTTLAAEQRRIVANLGSFPLSRDLRQARLASLREWWLSSPECSLRGVSKPQSATGEELRPFFGRTLLPSVYNDQKEKT